MMERRLSGIVDENGRELGSEKLSSDPAGNKVLSGAADHLRQILIEPLTQLPYILDESKTSLVFSSLPRPIGTRLETVGQLDAKVAAVL